MKKKEVKEEVKADMPAELSKEQMDAIIAKAEADALAKVCKAVGTSPEQLKDMEKNRKKAGEIGQYNLGTIVCKINGQTFTGKGTATREVCEQLVSMAAAKRRRLINEKIGKDAEVVNAINGGVSFKIKKAVDEAGIELSEV